MEKKYEFLNPAFMTEDEINFILLDPSINEISSLDQKKAVRSEMVEILRNDRTGTLLLPFLKNPLSL
jgi:hypothetical protein